MSKKQKTEQIVVRLDIEQDTYLRDTAELHGVAVSDLIRALIEQARINERVDAAIATLDEALGVVPDAVRR